MHVLRQQVVEQHDARAGVECRRELAESGVERQRQRREQRVVGAVVEVRGDALRARDHVPMRQHDALRLAGAARRVEDRRHVGVDDAVPLFPGGHLAPADDVRRGVTALLRGVAGDDDVSEIGTRAQLAVELEKPLRRGHEDAHIAVTQDIADLLGLEQRVQGHEDAAGGCGAETGDDPFDPLVE
jgi:hypothetical protein